jgi:glycosyltransferase involved in cell wall biosynthesis
VTETISVSVIVPVYNHWHLVPDLLKCLEGQSLETRNFELLLVDNGSDDLPEDPGLPPFARLLVCRTPGSYAARNMAIAESRGSILAFTDADCRPSPQWLAAGLAAFDGQPETPRLVAGDVAVEPQDWDVMTPTEAYDVSLGLPQARYVSKGYAVTANLFVGRAVFDSVGLFDASRFSGGDAEFCRRAVASGVPLVFNQTARIVHPARRDWSELVAKRRRVKGGQITAGSIRRRLMYGVRSFLPPVFAWRNAIKAKQLTGAQRLLVCRLLAKLWIVDMLEVVRLLAGGVPLRR